MASQSIAAPSVQQSSSSPLKPALRVLARILVPVLSILGLWYLGIYASGLPAFVIPRPERVIETLFTDMGNIGHHLVETLRAAALGFVMANVVGIGLAVLFVALPIGRLLVMPAAIAIRNVPYVVLVTVLVLAFGDTLGSKVAIVTLAGFFPVLVNTYRGLLSPDQAALDRMRVLNASWWETFVYVRMPYAFPYIASAQEITGSGSIIVAIAAEWMISSSGLGYIINRAMQQYRGDQVYAVALIAATLSFGIYSFVHFMTSRMDWQQADARRN